MRVRVLVKGIGVAGIWKTPTHTEIAPVVEIAPRKYYAWQRGDQLDGILFHLEMLLCSPSVFCSFSTQRSIAEGPTQKTYSFRCRISSNFIDGS